MIFEYTVVYLSCAFIGFTISVLWIHQDNDSITPEQQTTIINLDKIYDELYDELYDEEEYDREEEKEEEEYYLNPLIYDISLCSPVNDSIPFYQSIGKNCAKRTKTPTAFKEDKKRDIQFLKSCLKKNLDTKL